MMSIDKEIRKAKFSECGNHRIWLLRQWDKTKPIALFIGLNPSKADGKEDDATITRIKGIAAHNGFGGFYMMNLFTFISTDPDQLDLVAGNVPTADMALKFISSRCDCVVFAWGSFKVLGRDKFVIDLFPVAKALHINKNGSPKHPLYCKTTSNLIDFAN